VAQYTSNVSVARAALAQTEAALNQAQIDLHRYEQLQRQGYLPDQTLEEFRKSARLRTDVLNHALEGLPTDRIVMVDVRNLDPKERTLIEATDVTIAAIEPGRAGVPMREAIDALAAKCDVIYLHIDEDVLDERYVPNHGTVEPNGPDMDAVLNAVRIVLATGKGHGYGLGSVMHFYNPECIILGGGVIEAIDLLFERAVHRARITALASPASKTKILRAKLGDFSGVVGAACLGAEAAGYHFPIQ